MTNPPGPGWGPAPGHGWTPGPGWGPLPPPRPVHPDRDPYAYLPSLIGTVLALPVLGVCSILAMISPMATDACSPHGCHALLWALAAAPCLIAAGFGALAVSWALPRRRRLRVVRTLFAVAAPLCAMAAGLVYLHLPGAD